MNMSKSTKKRKNEVEKKTAIEMPGSKQEAEPQEHPVPQAPPMREIRILTDGTSVQVAKAEVTNLEFQAVLENLLRTFHQGKQ